MTASRVIESTGTPPWLRSTPRVSTGAAREYLALILTSPSPDSRK